MTTITAQDINNGVSQTASSILSSYPSTEELTNFINQNFTSRETDESLRNAIGSNISASERLWENLRAANSSEYTGQAVEGLVYDLTEKGLVSLNGLSQTTTTSIKLITTSTVNITQAVTEYFNNMPVRSYIEKATGKIVTSETVFSSTTHIPYGTYLAGLGRVIGAYGVLESMKETFISAYNVSIGNEADTFEPVKNYLIASSAIIAGAAVGGALAGGGVIIAAGAAALAAGFAGYAMETVLKNVPNIIEDSKALGRSLEETWDIITEIVNDQFSEIWEATGDVASEILDRGQEITNDIHDGVQDLASDLSSAVSKSVSDFMNSVADFFNGATGRGSPLVLDLDGDGVELTDVGSSGAVYFDVDNNGFREATGWVGGGDGLLAIDLNANGAIDDGGELFGNVSGGQAFDNGFLALGAYDQNADGQITQEDAPYADLRVWVDANGDGYSQAGELQTLSDLNITSIDLNYSDVSYQIANNDVLQESSFTINGNTRDIVDAWFQTSTVNTTYDEAFTLDVNALFLPTFRGYGQLADLYIAASLDNTGTNNLLGQLQALADKDLSQLFTADTSVMDDVRDILYRWASVDSVDPDSRGGHANAQELGFLEALMGQHWLQGGVDANPRGIEAG